MKCPKCNEECDRDEVDVGVGVIYGPWGCHNCYWSEDAQYDRSDNKIPPAQKENPDYYVDQFGGMQKITRIVESAERFGIPKDLVEDAFRIDKKEEKRCPKCGYTKKDALIHGDHYLCHGKIPE